MFGERRREKLSLLGQLCRAVLILSETVMLDGVLTAWLALCCMQSVHHQLPESFWAAFYRIKIMDLGEDWIFSVLPSNELFTCLLLAQAVTLLATHGWFYAECTMQSTMEERQQAEKKIRDVLAKNAPGQMAHAALTFLLRAVLVPLRTRLDALHRDSDERRNEGWPRGAQPDYVRELLQWRVAASLACFILHVGARYAYAPFRSLYMDVVRELPGVSVFITTLCSVVIGAFLVGLILVTGAEELIRSKF